MHRIMIIDSDIRQMNELNLGLCARYRILNCSRGANAMDLFRLYQPSALILDPATEEFNGPDLIRQVRSSLLGSRLPILALTRITTLRHLEQSFHWKVDAIFSKPCPVERVKKKLEDCLIQAISSTNLQNAAI